MGFVKKEYGSGSSFLWKRVRLRGMKDFEVIIGKMVFSSSIFYVGDR